MMRSGLAAILAMLPTLAGAAPSAPVDVMVLGSYHFASPGLDVNNIKVDSVMTPARQAELARVATAILAFKPTRVMVERESTASDLAYLPCANANPALLRTEPGEVVQIGCRVAWAAKASIHGIDEQPGPGEPDYFPIDKVRDTAARFGQAPLLEVANQPVAVMVKAFEAAQGKSSIAQLLIRMNRPGNPATTMDTNYRLLAIGDRDAQAGAELNAAYYLRNAKIFGKLMSVAQPGDRVLVVYGAGHSFWLRHFASLTPGYRVVDPLPYLERAAAAN